MSDATRDEEPVNLQTPPLAQESGTATPMEDEEKILAGRIDVNLPALLTKDVQGG
jgi:hypothetical protein